MLVETPPIWYLLIPEHQLYRLDSLANLMGGNQITVIQYNEG
jgi:hypothetical protein